MAFKVRIQPTAQRELDATVSYLLGFGPNTAAAFLDDWERMLTRLRDGNVEHLSRFLPLARLGYHSVLVGNYIALYFVEGDVAVIAHLLHQSQDYATLVLQGL